jgi:hypothetical protein
MKKRFVPTDNINHFFMLFFGQSSVPKFLISGVECQIKLDKIEEEKKKWGRQSKYIKILKITIDNPYQGLSYRCDISSCKYEENVVEKFDISLEYAIQDATKHLELKKRELFLIKKGQLDDMKNVCGMIDSVIEMVDSIKNLETPMTISQDDRNDYYNRKNMIDLMFHCSTVEDLPEQTQINRLNMVLLCISIKTKRGEILINGSGSNRLKIKGKHTGDLFVDNKESMVECLDMVIALEKYI